MTLTDYMSRNEGGGGGLTSIEYSIDVLVQLLEGKIEKREEGLIKATRNDTANTRNYRTTITRQ